MAECLCSAMVVSSAKVLDLLGHEADTSLGSSHRLQVFLCSQPSCLSSKVWGTEILSLWWLQVLVTHTFTSVAPPQA